MRNRHTVRGTQTAEVPALHRTGKTFTDGEALHVDLLTSYEVVSRQFGTHVQQTILVHAELGDVCFGFNLSLRESFALRLGRIFGLLNASAQLESDVAVTLHGTLADDLAAVELEYSNRHVCTIIGEHAGHTQLFGDHARAHRIPPLLSLDLDLDIHASRQIELHQRVYGLGSGVDDIEHAFVRADFKLLARLLVDVRRAVHGKFLDQGRQRDRTTYSRARALGGVNDFARREVEDAMIEGLEPDADALIHIG